MCTLKHLDRIYTDRGPAAAFDLAYEKVRDLEAQLSVLYSSRFFEKRKLDDGTKKLVPTSERQISEFIDMADAHGETAEFLYCDSEGTLHPITTGQLQRNPFYDEKSIWYGTSAMIANGLEVGTVHHSDH